MIKPFDTAVFLQRMTEILPGMRQPTVPLLVVVHLPGLTRENLGNRFEFELADRRRWCAENLNGEFAVEKVADNLGRRVGTRFRFADDGAACWFKLRFDPP